MSANEEIQPADETLAQDKEENKGESEEKASEQAKEPEETVKEPKQNEKRLIIQPSSRPATEERGIVSKTAENANTTLKSSEESNGATFVENSPTQLEELEQEVRYRDTVLWSVRVLEQSVDELEAQLEILQNEENDEESEFKLRCEAQRNLNSKLEEQIKWYNQEVMKMRERIKKGSDHSYDADLDAMNEHELAQLVKQLERERNNLYGDLRNKSWLLDNHSKEYYHYKELIKAYTGDLNHINRSLEQMWRQRSKSSGYGTLSVSGISSVISPGLLNWNSGESGIRPSHRILDPRKGPVRKTAGVRSLPKLDQKALEEYDAIEFGKKKRTRSMSNAHTRTKSLEAKTERTKKIAQTDHRSADELERDVVESSAATSVEPASEFSEDLTIESFTSSIS